MIQKRFCYCGGAGEKGEVSSMSRQTKRDKTETQYPEIGEQVVPREKTENWKSIRTKRERG